MKLYYLTSESCAKLILRERRVKISMISELNDPFELLGASIGGKRARKIVQYVQDRISEKFGLLCMSTTWQSPVMWAHYGDKHRGICLGFDLPDQAAWQVRYTPTRLTNLLSSNPKLSEIDASAIGVLLTTKAAEWSYEKEWRLLWPFKNIKTIREADGKRFIPIDGDTLELFEVIVGYRCSWRLRDVAKAVGKVKKKVRIKKIRPSFKVFEMVCQQNEPSICINP